MDRILKIKDWFKYQYPDYEGFKSHIEAWEEHGIPFGFKDLLKISKSYNIRPPEVVDGVLTFYEEPNKGADFIEHEFTIQKT